MLTKNNGIKNVKNNMEYLVVKSIPRKELKEFKDYINFLFKNENGVYNICRTEEDVMKTNQWFKNFPLKTIIVTQEPINVGDKFLAICNNQELSGRVFTLIDNNVKGEGLVSLQDDTGAEVISTKFILEDSYKFVRKANMADKEKLVNGKITPINI
jgi:hypothetical protein